MKKIEFFKTVLDLNIRKNNIIKLYLNKKHRGFLVNSYIEEENGIFSIEVKVKNINYYFYDNQSNNKYNGKLGYHEIIVFECINTVENDVPISLIEKIEVIKQSKTKIQEHPLITQIKKYAYGENLTLNHNFEEAIKLAHVLNIGTEKTEEIKEQEINKEKFLNYLKDIKSLSYNQKKELIVALHKAIQNTQDEKVKRYIENRIKDVKKTFIKSGE